MLENGSVTETAAVDASRVRQNDSWARITANPTTSQKEERWLHVVIEQLKLQEKIC